MPIIFRYFALVAAAVSAFNWAWMDRRLAAEPRSLTAEEIAKGRAILRLYFGGGIAFFLALTALQWLGGFQDPLFPIYDPTGNPWSETAWGLVFALWTAVLVGLWRPGIADIAVKLRMYRGPAMSGHTFRLVMTGVLIVNACACLALILGLWSLPALPR